MKNHKNVYFILGIILIIFVSLFLFREVILRPEQPIVENDELKLLKQIFSEKLIVPQDEINHYIVNGKDYYVKNISDLNKDSLTEFVVMERIKEGGKNYTFYGADSNIKEIQLLIDNIVDFEWYSGPEDYKNREIELFLKDITADGIDEIIVPYEKGKGSRAYQILTFGSDKKLIKMLNKNYMYQKPDEIIGFDTIERENNFVVTTWHATWSRGKSYYSVEDNILNFEKGIDVDFYSELGIEEYEYREIDKNGNIVYKETRKGSIWTDNLSR